MTQAEVISRFHVYALDPKELARWLKAQVGTWWAVDGDPVLTSMIAFPCPAEELADKLSRLDRPLQLLHLEATPTGGGARLGDGDLDRLADIDNKYQERTFLLRWSDSDEAWLLSEDKAAQKTFG